MPVTNENREEFVHLYLEWLLNNTISERFRAFYLGFHSVSILEYTVGNVHAPRRIYHFTMVSKVIYDGALFLTY